MVLEDCTSGSLTSGCESRAVLGDMLLRHNTGFPAGKTKWPRGTKFMAFNNLQASEVRPQAVSGLPFIVRNLERLLHERKGDGIVSPDGSLAFC